MPQQNPLFSSITVRLRIMTTTAEINVTECFIEELNEELNEERQENAVFDANIF